MIDALLVMCYSTISVLMFARSFWDKADIVSTKSDLKDCIIALAAIGYFWSAANPVLHEYFKLIAVLGLVLYVYWRIVALNDTEVT